jgi:site-specific recombinase XerD
MNSGKNTIESYGAMLPKLIGHFGKDRELAAIASEEILSFLNKISENGEQQTRHGRYFHLKAFFNFIKTDLDLSIIVKASSDGFRMHLQVCRRYMRDWGECSLS